MNTELILELCKYGYLDKDKIKKLLALTVDEVNLLGLIGMHRIGGMAFLVLKECNLLDKLNREFRSCLDAIYEHNLNLSYSFQKGLTYLSYIVDNADMPYVVLKGACLANLYPAGTRTSNDVDLLIRRQDIGQIVSLLKQEGFEQGFIRNEQIVAASRKEIINAQINRGEIIPLVKEVNWPSMKFMEIDINISLDNKAREGNKTFTNVFRCFFELGEMWNRLNIILMKLLLSRKINDKYVQAMLQNIKMISEKEVLCCKLIIQIQEQRKDSYK